MSFFCALHLRCAFLVFGLDTPGPQFRGISRERGRRSPLDRSQGSRPPWAHTLSYGEAEKPGWAVAPAELGFGRRRTPRTGGCGAPGGERRRLAEARGQTTGAHRGNAELPGTKAGGLAGKRRTAGAFRAASGAKNRAETGKTGRRRGCIGGFWRGFRGAKRGRRGGKGGISGL